MAHSISNRALGADPRDHARIAVLGCYVPLIDWERAEEAATLAAQTADPALASLVLQQIMEPYHEQDRRMECDTGMIGWRVTARVV